MLRPYFIGLQFLTRISLVKQDNWTEEDFGQSVKFFPLIGATLGIVYAAFAYVLTVLLPGYGIKMPVHFTAAVMLILPVLFTGGIHCDGFMDTMDGLFSGRKPERMLEIMKDSRVGSNGVFAFVTLMIFELCIILDMNPAELIPAFFVMPIIARYMMTLAIVFYPYARPEGMGKAFKMYADGRTLTFATVLAAIFVLPFGLLAWGALAVGFLFMRGFAGFAVNTVGGLTGDIYGCITTLVEGLVMLTFMVGANVI
ncbi:MAG: adenosylcobinamide-GDP ribazoletransferase [Selenomonadaceae bacterium]|nr:adenosylcobinamide-GDP ribazoletransferase [Selenomonadaceae bacterium]